MDKLTQSSKKKKSYTPEFKLKLSFEPKKIPINKGKTGYLEPVSPHWREDWNDFRTFKWTKEVECPELILPEVKRFLQIF